VTSADDPTADEDPEQDRSFSASPYEAPPEPEQKPSETDPSVFAEPWMEAVLHPPELSDPGPAMPLTDHVSEEQSVWDEPGLSRELAGEVPEEGLTWYRWYLDRVAATSVAWSWGVTLGVAVVGGLFAIVGTLVQQSMSGGQLVAVTIVGPTVEEIMKIALPLWLVEKRPWLYRNAGQILICAMASGLMFAAVENVLYLKVYINNPPAGLIQWRWTICVLLHSGCSTVAGIGAWKIWSRFQKERRAPVLADGAPWIVAAIVLHGLYNGTVTLLEFGGLDF
jgi:hypothetical protein